MQGLPPSHLVLRARQRSHDAHNAIAVALCGADDDDDIPIGVHGGAVANIG